MDVAAHIRWVFLHAEYARFGRKLARKRNPMLCNRVKRLPMLSTLPYWKVEDPAQFDKLFVLMDELELYGPMGGRWMYPCE